jgi:glyoxylase-like metal-dependent hydrolase (beta-lactamase superfamily II)
MTVKTLPLGTLATNCYIVSDDEGNAVAIDVGGDNPQEVESVVLPLLTGLNLQKILLTHGHFDHMNGSAFLAEKTGAKVYVHQQDAEMLTGSGDQFVVMGKFFPCLEFETIADGDVLEVGKLTFKVLHTPGHTRGCVCYITDDVVFAGDVLFRGDIGRDDLPGGNGVVFAKSLKKLFDVCTDNKTVYSGHGMSTEIEYERQNNPHLRL